MSIRRFFTKQLVVRKMKTTTGFKKKYRATATVEGHVQKMDDERTFLGGFKTGQTFLGWLPIDLLFTPKTRDQITDPQGRIFIVTEVEKWDFGINQHWELIMERYTPEND